MSISAALRASSHLANPESFERFRRHLDDRWLEEALVATGTATVRRRRLPAEQVIWLVLGMALFRDRAIEEVVDKLELALPGVAGPVAKSAIPQARKRLGAEPLKWIFERSAETWAHASADEHRWRGLGLYGIDGTTLRLPDTDANCAKFPKHSGGGYEPSGYPLVRMVVLMALRSHLLARAAVGAHAGDSEVRLAEQLLDAVPAQSLTVVDKGFLSAAFLLALESRLPDRHWLIRAKSNTSFRVLERYADGDELVEMKVTDTARALDPNLPRVWTARAVRYQRSGHPPQVLLTSMRDPVKYPSSEIAALYHERWELELAYDELKTEMLDARATLRSKSPDTVAQEIWGILLAFNLVRLEMERIAREAGVVPTRISFVAALHMIRDEWQWLSMTRSPGAIPKHLKELRARLKRLVLPPRRSERVYPRALKHKSRAYPQKAHAAKRPLN